jgi:Cu/Ag efflux protein CusF
VRTLTIYFILCIGSFLAACSSPQVNQPSTARPTPTPLKTPFFPKNGDYQGVGKITKINNDLGSVELDHQDIPDMMPAMKMEFFVTDKRLLKGLRVGDMANFTIRYKDGQENIVAISTIK